MSAAIWLVDFENVQKLDVARIPPDTQLKVFVGAKQSRLPTALVRLRETLKDRFEFVWIEGTGSNVLDFHVACHLGEALAVSPEAEFVIVSNDTGFDPLVRHLTARGIRCRRQGRVESGSKVAAKPELGDAAMQVFTHLQKVEKAKRPRKRQTLINYMTNHLKKKMSGDQVTAAIDQLVKRKQIQDSGPSLTYDF